MLYYSHRLDEAARAFERVRELAPEMPGGWYSGGMVALQQEDYASYVPLMLRSMEIDPNDHELLLKFADALLVLGLLEEAEPWHQRAIRLAPNAPSTRRFALDRYWARSEYEEMRDHAEEMLLDQVENRWGADTAAASYYVYSQRQLGALDDVQPFFERIYPGISNTDTIVATSRGFWIKVALMDALYEIDPAEAAEHARVVAGYVKDRFPAFLERARLRIGLLNMIGDRDAAIELALTEDFGARVVSGIANFKPDQAYEFFNSLKPLLSDPAIAARASEFRERRDQQAELVRRLLRESAGTDRVD
jgi:tetratricopeptide (TPR) repeat protein